ncbi:hypothetical protein Tco_0635881 [Tanacetum coccineum]
MESDDEHSLCLSSLLEELVSVELAVFIVSNLMSTEINIIESFSSISDPPNLFEGSDSLMDEIDIFLTPDDSMPSGMRMMTMTLKGISFSFKNCLAMIPLHFLKMGHFILMFQPIIPRPPAKPPDDGIYFEPDTGLLTAKVVGDISKPFMFLLLELVPHTQPPFVQ